MVNKQEFMNAAQKIRESETAPIRKPMDEGVPTIREVISNQKRLATMVEYMVQIIEESSKK